MRYLLSKTDNYHIYELNSLGWEMTIGNALYPESSPCRSVLKNKSSLGASLYNFLETLIPFGSVNNYLEIGAGLGYLTQDFLCLNPHLQATLLDISPYLLSRQKETLIKYQVSFEQADALRKDEDFFFCYDLVIMNENLGDFPALIPTDEDEIEMTQELIYYQNKALHFTNEYNIKFMPQEIINVGALTILENICRANVKYIYLSEHSCEAAAPDNLRELIRISPAGFPEKISLKGHNEYTIKFSHLQKIAQKFKYNVRRGPVADFLIPDFNDKLMATLRIKSPVTDEQEIIQQFVYDLYKYEYLLLTKNGEI